MNEAQAVVLIVLLFCAAFAFAVWLVHQDSTVVIRRREPSEFELAAQRFSESMKELQRAFAVALLPAFEETTRAINRFGALLREASNQESGPQRR